MKRTTLLMLALLCSAVMLLGEAINAAPLADDGTSKRLCCSDLEGCRNDLTCCPGPGIAGCCTITCQDGATILCKHDDVEEDKDN